MSVTAVLPPLVPSEARRGAWPSRRALLVGWVLALAPMLALLGCPPVQRTQEARVLETAREMLPVHWHRWLIPQLNGELRLRKPPLTYWLAAVAFKVGGVDEQIGRVPTVLAGWLTLGVTFLAAERLFGRRAGFFGAAALLSSYLFFRHTRLAETDAPAALGVTLGVYGILRAAPGWRQPRGRVETMANDDILDDASAPVAPPMPVPLRGHSIWLHLSALGAALALLSKGGPGVFPLLFLIGFAALTRRWDVPRRFITSGAILTLIVVGGAWYFYAAHASGPKQFISELRTLTRGDDHPGRFYNYFPQILVGSAPWSGVLILALVGATLRVRVDVRARIAWMWILSILVPLCLAGNKQFHYLVPLMPALMVLVGWAMAAAVDDPEAEADSAFGRAARQVVAGTFAVVFIAVLLLPLVARHELGSIRRADVGVAGALLAVIVLVAIIRRFAGRTWGMTAFLAGCAAALALLTGSWLPSLRPHNTRAVARDIRAVAPGPYCFFGGAVSLPLCYNLRSEIPRAKTSARLLELAEPGMGVIAETKAGKTAPQPPVDPTGRVKFIHVGHTVGEEDQTFELYRVESGGGDAGGEREGTKARRQTRRKSSDCAKAAKTPRRAKRRTSKIKQFLGASWRAWRSWGMHPTQHFHLRVCLRAFVPSCSPPAAAPVATLAIVGGTR